MCLSPDSTEPEVGLSSSSSSVTKESNIAIIIEFTKPVFGFKASNVEVEGGSLTRQVHIVILRDSTNVGVILLLEAQREQEEIFDFEDL